MYNIGREGDEVYLIDVSTAFVTGAEIEKFAESIKVYNLEIADFNTYFVGDEAVLVHNYNEYDVDEYGRFNNRKNAGDGIDGHEVIQNAWLQEHGYTTERGAGISRKNIAVGLKPEQHTLVNKLQRELGMYDTNYLKNVSWKQNLMDNLNILHQVGIPQEVIDKAYILSYIFGLKNKL